MRPGVDLGAQACPLLVVEGTDVDAGGGREIGEALVRARQARRGTRDCGEGCIVEVRDAQILKDEKVEVPFYESPHLPVEGKTVQHA